MVFRSSSSTQRGPATGTACLPTRSRHGLVMLPSDIHRAIRPWSFCGTLLVGAGLPMAGGRGMPAVKMAPPQTTSLRGIIRSGLAKESELARSLDCFAPMQLIAARANDGAGKREALCDCKNLSCVIRRRRR